MAVFLSTPLDKKNITKNALIPAVLRRGTKNIKSQEEMIEYFSDVPDAIENTVKIANKCEFEFEFGVTKLPNYNVPEEFKTHE